MDHTSTIKHNNSFVEFKEGGKTLQLIFIKRLYSYESEGWDKDIILAEVRFTTPSMEGGFSANIWSTELNALKNLLQKIISQIGKSKSEEKFEFMEEAVKLNISLSATGQIETEVTVCSNTSENELAKFTLYLDQSYLPSIIESLEGVLIEFPIQVNDSNS